MSYLSLACCQAAHVGAIQGSSPTHGLIFMIHKILSALEGTQCYVRLLLLDFSKAFDHIDHNILLTKLKENKIPDVLISWQHAFLSGRTQCVKIGTDRSEYVPINGGVPQGTLSGPEDFLHMMILKPAQMTQNMWMIPPCMKLYRLMKPAGCRRLQTKLWSGPQKTT